MTEGIELQSIVESHDRPFLVIDRDFNVVAMNRAYRKAFHVAGQVQLGRKCFSVIHHREHPCYELGEDCPYLQAYLTHQPHSCLHTHYDEQGRERRVRVKLYPLIGSDGTLYMGEMLQEITARGDEQPRDSARPVGRSPAFLYAMEQLEQAARADAPVLLLGETGTGKELAAHFVHHQSRRRLRPFIAVDCAVLTEQLFESELFGHERGAFTGSVPAKPGLIEAAQGGTLFLDEIGEASPAMQAKLLRVLETGEYRRLGSTKVMKSDRRIVCATNRHLWEEVKRGTFREDLYYRIAVFCIRVPPCANELKTSRSWRRPCWRRLDGRYDGPIV